MGSSSPALSNMQFLVLLSAVALALAYVHDATGDVAVDDSPAALPYVHDATGDVADDASPAAEPYVHDATGDVAVAYVHEEPVVVTPTPLLPTTLAASTTLAAWCPAPKSFKIETKRPTEDRKGQRTTREQELDIGGRSVGPTVLVGPLVSAQDLDN